MLELTRGPRKGFRWNGGSKAQRPRCSEGLGGIQPHRPASVHPVPPQHSSDEKQLEPGNWQHVPPPASIRQVAPEQQSASAKQPPPGFTHWHEPFWQLPAQQLSGLGSQGESGGRAAVPAVDHIDALPDPGLRTVRRYRSSRTASCTSPLAPEQDAQPPSSHRVERQSSSWVQDWPASAMHWVSRPTLPKHSSPGQQSESPRQGVKKFDGPRHWHVPLSQLLLQHSPCAQLAPSGLQQDPS